MKAAAVGAGAAEPVASARSALPPAEEVAAVSGAKVRLPVAAEALPVPSVQPPGVAGAEAAASAAQVQPPEAAVAGPDVVPLPAAVAAEQPDAAGRLPEEPAVVRLDVEELQPEAGEPQAQVPSVQQQVAAHPSVAAGRPWPDRPPWLAPRQAERSAHAMRKSRTASPSRRLWRAAGCEGLS
jgi:hypothetical protein